VYDGDIAATLVTADAIREKTAELAVTIGEDYPEGGSDLLLVGVLKGAVMFMTDLARALPVPVQLEFMAVSSYGSATSSSGVVRILKDLDRDIAGRDVLIVEDIIDSGLTLSWLLGNLRSRNPASLSVCTLLRKPDAVKSTCRCATSGSTSQRVRRRLRPRLRPSATATAAVHRHARPEGLRLTLGAP
jgi:hypoxanthine phosphoribosyltransferase